MLSKYLVIEERLSNGKSLEVHAPSEFQTETLYSLFLLFRICLIKC